MKLSTKKTIVVSTLLVLMLWPPLHRALVARYELDPWKLFGWAMYCTQFRIAYQLDTQPNIDWGGDKRLRRPLNFMSQRHRIYGNLYSHEQFARELFDLNPQVNRVDIGIQRVGIDSTTAKLKREPIRRISYDRHEVLGFRPD